MRAISTEQVERTRAQVLETVCSPTLTHEQKIGAPERHANSFNEVLDVMIDVLDIVAEALEVFR